MIIKIKNTIMSLCKSIIFSIVGVAGSWKPHCHAIGESNNIKPNAVLTFGLCGATIRALLE